ncbi:hypothetical protein BpHYR1_052370 [Brachionus plicatilis]|uniref:Uncharacterized protein n=1 Tax=Brachionus plicatilis TaxID=10195 RepID=A0A3M7QRQ7_BRAPC|nr:hypothetical protein BpHYR1_052370 [Brachionus plicatilis]
MRGVDRKYLQSYLDEFVWRHNLNLSRHGAFEAILESISVEFSPEIDGKNLKDFGFKGTEDSDNKFEKDDDEMVENLHPDLQDGDINDFVYEYI